MKLAITLSNDHNGFESAVCKDCCINNGKTLSLETAIDCLTHVYQHTEVDKLHGEWRALVEKLEEIIFLEQEVLEEVEEEINVAIDSFKSKSAAARVRAILNGWKDLNTER